MTMPAPKSTAQLGYVANFVRSGINTSLAYGTADFDASGYHFAPAVVGNVANTLGAWYYDTDNPTYSDDPGRPATQYPFSETEFSPLSGGARYTTAPGEAFKMAGATGKYERSFGMAAGNELTYVFGQRHPLAIISGSSTYDPSSTLAAFTSTAVSATYTKQIIADADGKQAVVFMDASGKEVARCLAGKITGGTAKTTTISIPVGEYRDIHIADQAGANTTVNFSGTLYYSIYNLETYNDFSLPAEIITSTGGSSSQSLAKGFYRIVNTGPVACTVVYDLYYYNFSLSIYDLNGNMVSSIPPIAVKYNAAANSTTPPSYSNTERSQFSWYRYNSMGQLIWDQTPDGGNTRYYYRKDGKIRFSQNPRQLAESKYSYRNYLSNGRVDEAGEASLTGLNSVSTANIVLGGGVDNSAMPVNGANNSVKLTYILTKYDEAYSTPAGKTQTNLVGRVTYIEKKQGATTLSKAWYSYDILGRPNWTGQLDEANIGNKYTNYFYDLLGNAREIVFQKANADEFRHLYSFNNEGRLESVSTRKDSTATTLPEIAVEYTYYKTGGAMKSASYHDNFKTQTYSYTLQGQLKGINVGDFTGFSPSTTNLFSMLLDYYPTDFRTSMAVAAPTAPAESPASTTTFGYTGQIARQRWMTGATVGLSVSSGIYAYTYKYNQRNELSDAQFAVASFQSGVPHLLTYQSQYREYGLTYDLNGNLKTLSRNGAGVSPSSEVFSYDYTSTLNPTQINNQLRRISGTFNLTSVGGLNNQVNAATTSAGNENYKFDASGRLTDDITENVKMDYDVYGKVVKVYNRTTSALKTEFVYNADGMRIKKIAYGASAGNLVNTYYAYAGSTLMGIYEETFVGGASSDPSLKELPIYGGSSRVGTVKVAASPANYLYRYELRDHLGNVRCTFGRGTGGTYNTLYVDYYADYYAYGWTLPARNGGTYRYGFQGENAEKDPETGWVAFELRQYDGRVGRWMTVDPENEFYSPYLAFGNDPINTTDPSGGSSDGIIIPTSKTDAEYQSTVLCDLDFFTNDELVIGADGRVYISAYSKYETPTTIMIRNQIWDKHDITILPAVEKNAGGEPDNKTTFQFPQAVRLAFNSTGTNAVIFYNPYNSGSGILNADGSVGRPSRIGLMHELLHAELMITGTNTPIQILMNDPDGGPTFRIKKYIDEYDIRKKENIIRRSFDVKPRAKATINAYFKNLNNKGNYDPNKQ